VPIESICHRARQRPEKNLHRCCCDAGFFYVPMSQKYRDASNCKLTFALDRRRNSFAMEINFPADINDFTIANIFNERLFFM
jgi:hypothetical protein